VIVDLNHEKIAFTFESSKQYQFAFCGSNVPVLTTAFADPIAISHKPVFRLQARNFLICEF